MNLMFGVVVALQKNAVIVTILRMIQALLKAFIKKKQPTMQDLRLYHALQVVIQKKKM